MKTITLTDDQLEQVYFALQDRIGNLLYMVEPNDPQDPIRRQIASAQAALVALLTAGFAPR